jgi:hypothetical protein
MRNAGGIQEQCCWDSLNKERRGHVIKSTSRQNNILNLLAFTSSTYE